MHFWSAVFVGFSRPAALGWVLIPLAFSAAATVGAIWLFLLGYLLAKFEGDEVVSTLMLNFIAAGVTGYLVNGPLLSPVAGNNVTPLIQEVAFLPRLMSPSTLHAGFLVGLVCVATYGFWCARIRPNLLG